MAICTLEASEIVGTLDDVSGILRLLVGFSNGEISLGGAWLVVGDQFNVHLNGFFLFLKRRSASFCKHVVTRFVRLRL